MIEHGLDRRTGLRARLAEPVRRVVAWVLTDQFAASDESVPATDSVDWIVDCGVYAGGRRMPGRPDYRTALALARNTRGFVWLGLHEPAGADFEPVARAFGLDELMAEHALAPDHRPAV